MDILDSEKEINNKIYDLRSILIATFFGGPLAGSYLIGKNFKYFGNQSSMYLSISMGVIVTLLLISFALNSEAIIDNELRNDLLPILYMAATYGITEYFQGKKIKEHKKNEGEIYSAWKAVGIGLLCLLLIFVGIVIWVMNNDIESI